MASLFQRSHRLGIALAIALGLTVMAAITKPLLSDQLVHVPYTDEVLIAETENGGG